MKRRLAVKLIIPLIIVTVLFSFLYYEKVILEPKFYFRLTLDTSHPIKTGGSVLQDGYIYQNQSNTLNFTALTNSTVLLYNDQFRNNGISTIHNISVNIESISEDLVFGSANFIGDSLKFTPYNSINFPIPIYYGTLNSSDYRSNDYGFHIQTSIIEGKYEIGCRAISEEISFPFNVTINVITQ